MGLQSTVTMGIISNPKQLIEGKSFIQMDAAISSGNSGGPVLNREAKVIGIVNGYIIDAQNLNLAIPINEIKHFIDVEHNLALTADSETIIRLFHSSKWRYISRRTKRWNTSWLGYSAYRKWNGSRRMAQWSSAWNNCNVYY